MKKKTKRQLSYWFTLAIAVTTSYFVWLSWNKLTDYFGDSDLVWMITGGIVLVALIIGHFGFKTLAEKFT